MRGTLHQAPNGQFAIRFVRQVVQAPGHIWPFITTPDGLRSWLFPAPVDLSGPAGTDVSFVFPENRAPTQSGRIIASNYPSLLEFTWGDEIIRWDLTPTPQGDTKLVFTNIFPDRDSAAPLAAGWHAALDVLEARLAGREVDWDAWDRAESLTATYDQSFAATSVAPAHTPP